MKSLPGFQQLPVSCVWWQTRVLRNIAETQYTWYIFSIFHVLSCSLPFSYLTPNMLWSNLVPLSVFDWSFVQVTAPPWFYCTWSYFQSLLLDTSDLSVVYHQCLHESLEIIHLLTCPVPNEPLSYGNTKMIGILLVILQPQGSYSLWWEHTGKQTRTSHYDRYYELTYGQEGRDSVSLDSLRSMAQNNDILAASEHLRGAARAFSMGEQLMQMCGVWGAHWLECSTGGRGKGNGKKSGTRTRGVC